MPSTYKITCATRSGDAPHDHVVSIGIGPNSTLSVDEVRDNIDNATTYYVYADGKSAVIEKFDCDCGAKTVVSESDATEKNNVNALPSC